MSGSKIDSLKQTSSTHHVLIGVPLVVVVVFCFSFVLLQPTKTDPTLATANQGEAPKPTPPVSDTATPELAAIPLAEQTSLPTLEEAAPTGGTPGTVATGTPQASSKSNPKGANPQGVAAGRQIGPNTVIQVSNNNPFRNLTNLLR